jgi:hypothetical protein
VIGTHKMIVSNAFAGKAGGATAKTRIWLFGKRD